MALVVGLVQSALSAELAAQAATNLASVWATIGLGSVGDGLIATSSQFAVQERPHRVTVRYIHTQQLAEDESDSGADGLVDLGVLYSRTLVSQRFQFSAGAGLGAAIKDSCPRFESPCPKQIRLALPLAAEASLRLLPVVGLGFQAFSSINSIDTTIGGLIVLQVGWMRR